MGTPTAPFLSWTPEPNPVLGKLKLQSMERSNIFFEWWVHLILYKGGMIDMSGGLFPVSPYSLNKYTKPKKTDVPNTTTVINGLFEDTMGRDLKTDLDYTIKVFVWIETEEEADGVVFDFQEEKTQPEKNSETPTETKES